MCDTNRWAEGGVTRKDFEALSCNSCPTTESQSDHKAVSTLLLIFRTQMTGQCEKFASVGHQSTLCLPDVMHVTGSPTRPPLPLQAIKPVGGRGLKRHSRSTSQ